MEAIKSWGSESETVRELPLALLPEISYRKALSSRFVLEHTTYTVSACPIDTFRCFVSKCGQASFNSRLWGPVQQGKLLRLLEKDCSDVARWYALNILLEHKVAIPLEVE